MTNIDITELEAKARAATDGYWNFNGSIAVSSRKSKDSLKKQLVATVSDRENGEFIAAANPSAILFLISELSAAREENARLRDALRIIDGRCVGSRSVTRPILEAYWKGQGK